MDTTDKISIIIPTYNRAHIIVETLESIQLQSFQNWECVIIDDGSNDNTKEVVEKFTQSDNRIVFYPRPTKYKKGANACRNYGLSQSRGDFIQWFDSDDIMHPDFLLEKATALKTTNLDMVFGRAYRFDGDFSNCSLESTVNYMGGDLLEGLIKGEFTFGTPLPMWRKSFLDAQNSHFRTDLFQSQDLEFYSRLLAAGPKFQYVPKSKMFIRNHQGSISSSYNSCTKEFIRSYVEVRSDIIALVLPDKNLVLILIRQMLYAFRLCVSEKKYGLANDVIRSVKDEIVHLSFPYQLKFLRIRLTFLLLRFLGRGEVRFKPYLKL